VSDTPRSPLAALNAVGTVRPTLLDRVIGYVAPQVALDRYAARVRLASSQALWGPPTYDSASIERVATKNWRPRRQSANADVESSREFTTARTRDLVRNTGLVAGAEHTIVTSTIGAGLSAYSAIDAELLGLSDDEADAWERDADRYFELWQEQADVEGRHHFSELSALAIRAEFQSGDVFAIRRAQQRTGDLFATRIQLVEGDRVSTPREKQEGASLVGGIEIDQDGRPLKYYIADEIDPRRLSFTPTKWSEVPATDALGPLVLHLLRPGRPGQRRGISPLAPIVEQLRQLTQYSQAELTAAVVASFFTVFVKRAAPVVDDAPVFNTGGPLDAAPQLVPQPASRQVDLGHGSVVELDEGESIEIADPKRPNANFDPFFLAMLRQVGVALELPFELLVKHFTASYSASRAAIQEAYRATLTRRVRHVRQFCQPVRAWVITEAVARGYLRAPGFFTNPLLRRAWLGCEWFGPPISSLNPVHEIEAAGMRIDRGVSTLAEVTAEMTGGSWERKHRQRVKEVTRRRADGLELVASTRPAAATVVTDSDEEVSDAA
jgi:lambda family phage portal protein